MKQYKKAVILAIIIILCFIPYFVFYNDVKNLESFESNINIPKVIHRTLLWDKEVPSNVKKMYDTFHKKNKDWKVKVWNMQQCRDLAKKYNLLDIFDNLKLKIQKADLSRYLIIYDKGGCYVDFDISSNYTLTEIAQKQKRNQSLTLVVEFCHSSLKNKEKYCTYNKIYNKKRYNNNMIIRKYDKNNNNIKEEPMRIANYFLMAKPKSKELFDIIELVKQRSKLEIKNQYDVLYTTGPGVLSSYCHDNNHNINIIHNKYIIHRPAGSWRNQIKK